MRVAFALLLAAGMPAVAPAQAVGPSRAAIVDAQKHLNNRLAVAGGRDPMEVLNSAQGVYLRGIGSIFTAQVDLIITPALTPFRQKMEAAQVAVIRRRKLEHLPLLRQAMQESLISTAKTLDALPLNEHVVLAVSLTYFYWEDRNGLPSQIVMKGVREPLMKGAANAIQVDEY